MSLSASTLNITTTITGWVEFERAFNTMIDNARTSNVGEIVNYCLAQVENGARAAAPVLTGRLRNSIIHYMVSDTAGICEALAPYAAAQERGFVMKSGKRFPGRFYFRPNADRGKALFFQLMQRYIAGLASGQKFIIPIAPQGTKGTVSGAGAKVRVHRYTQKRVGPTGKVIYVYGAGKETVGRRFKTYKPSPKKKLFPGRRISGRR